jgi:hypothetical protein
MSTQSLLPALCALVVSSAAFGQLGGRLPGGPDWDKPVAPPAQNPPAPTPAPTPAPEPAPAANPEVAAKIAGLRALVAQRQGITADNIQVLPSLQVATEKARSYRRLVDRTLRQPFLAGVNPSPELMQRVKESHGRWGDLARSIRAGKPPESLPTAALVALRLPNFTPPAGESVKLTGALWSKMSDEYFRQTLALENLGADLAKHVRASPKMRELAVAMDRAERLLARKVTGPDAEAWRRALTWSLHGVWLLGVELQIKLLERQLTANPEAAGVEEFLKDMDAARGLRHRGISLSREGGAPPPDGTPAELVRVPSDGTITVAMAGTDRTSVEVAPPAANRLPQLAAELYHAHYLLRQVEDFERAMDVEEKKDVESARTPQERAERLREHLQSRRTRIAERQRDSEGRRLQVVHEMTEEADWVLGGAR